MIRTILFSKFVVSSPINLIQNFKNIIKTKQKKSLINLYNEYLNFTRGIKKCLHWHTNEKKLHIKAHLKSLVMQLLKNNFLIFLYNSF